MSLLKSVGERGGGDKVIEKAGDLRRRVSWVGIRRETERREGEGEGEGERERVRGRGGMRKRKRGEGDKVIGKAGDLRRRVSWVGMRRERESE